MALLRNASGFAEAYLANGRKASDAARTIGVTGSAGSIAVKANRLLKQARESGLLEKRLEEIAAAMGVDEVLERLSVITRASGENSPDKETEETMSRANNFHGKPGPGRPKGARNKATQEARALAGKYLTAEGYDESLVDRLKAGKAPHMEVLLWHYWKGKPKEAVEVEGSESLAAGRSSRRHVAGARTSKQAPAST